MSEDIPDPGGQKRLFTCYPSDSEDNPLLVDAIPGFKYTPLVVVLHITETHKPFARVYRDGKLIAHSAVEPK